LGQGNRLHVHAMSENDFIAATARDDYAGYCALSMVAGKVIYKDGQFANVDVSEVHTRLLEASERLQSAVAADPLTDDLPIVQLTREGKM
jgi:hypothetical protein